MAIVAGVDFGTQSVRVSLFDSERGRLGAAAAEYPVLRKRDDPDYATQRHTDHMNALAEATQKALAAAGISGDLVGAIALDTTGSTVIPLGEGLQPLDDYYLWCDHRAKSEAAEITKHARESSLEALNWCGGVYSSEWGFSKLLHWLRHNPDKRGSMVTAMEHCDLVAADLCGITDPAEAPRSICAMGHKWMWNAHLGGLPPEEFLVGVDPLLAGVRAQLDGRYETSDVLAGHLSAPWAERLGLPTGIPVPVGAFDAHWDAIGAGIREGDVVNVVGTSTCMMAIAREVGLIPGVCGVVKGSIHPDYYGIEAGLSAVGDIFEAIARRAGSTVAELSKGLGSYKAGSTGLLRMTWDNGDRTVLVNPELGGVTLGWTLGSTAADELFAAIEGTAFHTRIILERMAGHGVTIHRVINGGGIPQKNATLNRVYANVFNKPVLVPTQEVTSLGSAIFAFMAAGTFKSIDEAQAAMCPTYHVIEPDPAEAAVYEQLFQLYQKLYFALGQPGSDAVHLGEVLPALRKLRGQSSGV
ncbi:ribulokinase [Paludibaculum fermentans]|uniref:ribulokinase n=1 Tax=Paludibaculum fermentans TaxID=1473598 RepID=UPI003EBBD715